MSDDYPIIRERKWISREEAEKILPNIDPKDPTRKKMHCKTCGDWTCENIRDVHHLVCYGTEEDVDGNFHYHDRNARWQEWKCSKGHVFKCMAYNQCWCGWSSQYPDVCKVEFKENIKTFGYKFSSGAKLINNGTISLSKLIDKNEQ